MLKSVNHKLRLACIALSMAMTIQVQAQGDTDSSRDPFEKFNRGVYVFNNYLDRWLFKPIAEGYTYIAPAPVEIMVNNFFSNLGEVRNVTNSLLQRKWADASTSTGRFLVNSTVGLLGAVDVGSDMGLHYKYNDFDLTLAEWSVPAGPYLVLPFVGPRTLRSATSLIADAYTSPITYVTPERNQYLLAAGDVTNFRAQLLQREDLVIGDQYTFVRDAYLQHRDFLASDGEAVQDDF